MIDFINLELIEFHDVVLKCINIQKESPSKLLLEIMLWEEDKEDHLKKTLVFSELNHIEPEIILINANSELEIYSFNYFMKDNLFYGKLIVLTGFGKPSIEIDFSCRTVEVI